MKSKNLWRVGAGERREEGKSCNEGQRGKCNQVTITCYENISCAHLLPKLQCKHGGLGKTYKDKDHIALTEEQRKRLQNR